MFLYVIRDRVSQKSGFIMEADNDLVANRNFQRMFKQDPLLDPAEFKLFKIGEWDHEEDYGQFYETIEQVIIGVDNDE